MFTKSILIQLARCNLTANDFRPVFTGAEQMFGRLLEDLPNFCWDHSDKLHAALNLQFLELFFTHLYNKFFLYLRQEKMQPTWSHFLLYLTSLLLVLSLYILLVVLGCTPSQVVKYERKINLLILVQLQQQLSLPTGTIHKLSAHPRQESHWWGNVMRYEQMLNVQGDASSRRSREKISKSEKYQFCLTELQIILYSTKGRVHPDADTYC